MTRHHQLIAWLWRQPSAWPAWWPEAAWATFFLANVGIMLVKPHWQPVPFHLVWVSVMVLCGYRQWPVARTAALLGAVGAITGVAVLMSGMSAEARLSELADVPLMYVVFIVLVWHARGRTAALARARRAAERELDFVRDASHQLRTPITIARGHIELIAGGPDTGSARDAGVVLAELERLQRIADRLLILAAVEEPRSLMLESVPLGDLVAAAALRWTVVAERRWTIETGPTACVLVDRARIDAALDALIENAIKATSRGDPIAVQAIRRGDVPILAVADRGAGVAPEDRERIFERFTRVPQEASGSRGGTGLGLPMVRAIAEAHGGTASIVPHAGAWTTFELQLERFVHVTRPPQGALRGLATRLTGAAARSR